MSVWDDLGDAETHARPLTQEILFQWGCRLCAAGDPGLPAEVSVVADAAFVASRAGGSL